MNDYTCPFCRGNHPRPTCEGTGRLPDRREFAKSDRRSPMGRTLGRRIVDITDNGGRRKNI